MLRNQGPSHPLPLRIASLPQLEERILAKRRESLAAALERVKEIRSMKTASTSGASARSGGGRGGLAAALEEAEDVAANLASLLETAGAEGKAHGASDVEGAGSGDRLEFSSALVAHAHDPVFATLSAPQMLRLLHTAVDMYREDVALKTSLLGAVEAAVEKETRAGPGPGPGVDVNRAANVDGRGERDELMLDLSHETLTTCVATWILSPRIDTNIVAEIDTLAALEMK